MPFPGCCGGAGGQAIVCGGCPHHMGGTVLPLVLVCWFSDSARAGGWLGRWCFFWPCLGCGGRQLRGGCFLFLPLSWPPLPFLGQRSAFSQPKLFH